MSHEYHVLTDVGDDTIAECGTCLHHANLEAAVGMSLCIHTPHHTTPHMNNIYRRVHMIHLIHFFA